MQKKFKDLKSNLTRISTERSQVNESVWESYRTRAIQESLDQHPLEVSTMTPDEIAKKHGVPLSFINQQLKQGIEVESEHTPHREAAREIALDHLKERPDYYKKLAKYVELKEAEEPNNLHAGHVMNFSGHTEHSFHGFSRAKQDRDAYAAHLKSQGHKVRKHSITNQLLHGMYGNVYKVSYVPKKLRESYEVAFNESGPTERERASHAERMSPPAEPEHYKVGDSVIPKEGPHAGRPHTVIHVHPTGHVNIKPTGVSAKYNRYHLGAARAHPDQITRAPLQEDLREIRRAIRQKQDEWHTLADKHGDNHPKTKKAHKELGQLLGQQEDHYMKQWDVKLAKRAEKKESLTEEKQYVPPKDHVKHLKDLGFAHAPETQILTHKAENSFKHPSTEPYGEVVRHLKDHGYTVDSQYKRKYGRHINLDSPDKKHIVQVSADKVGEFAGTQVHFHPPVMPLKEEVESQGRSFNDAVAHAIKHGRRITYGTASRKWHSIGPEDRDYHTSFALDPQEAKRQGMAHSLLGSTSARMMKEAKFEKTYCSQCGADLGPGECGASHCGQHRRMPGMHKKKSERDIAAFQAKHKGINSTTVQEAFQAAKDKKNPFAKKDDAQPQKELQDNLPDGGANEPNKDNVPGGPPQEKKTNNTPTPDRNAKKVQVKGPGPDDKFQADPIVTPLTTMPDRGNGDYKKNG